MAFSLKTSMKRGKNLFPHLTTSKGVEVSRVNTYKSRGGIKVEKLGLAPGTGLYKCCNSCESPWSIVQHYRRTISTTTRLIYSCHIQNETFLFLARNLCDKRDTYVFISGRKVL